VPSSTANPAPFEKFDEEGTTKHYKQK